MSWVVLKSQLFQASAVGRVNFGTACFIDLCVNTIKCVCRFVCVFTVY